MNGVLPLWKPKGMTSHDCVKEVRNLFKTKKVGHTGTLDPAAEGVLPICIGKATKLVPYLQNEDKTYIAQVSLGKATDTEDAEGNVVSEKKIITPPTNEEIDEVLTLFLGKIIQVPPMYSAVKVKGKKLYEYARNNQKVNRPKRNVTIYNLKRLNAISNKNTFYIQVNCSKGTYIRTLCVDIGKQLGFPAHMSSLIRIQSGFIKEKDTVTFSQIERALAENNEMNVLTPMLEALKGMDQIEVNTDQKRKVLNGQLLKKPKKHLKTNPFTIIHEGKVLAIYEIHPKLPNNIKPVRILNE